MNLSTKTLSCLIYLAIPVSDFARRRLVYTNLCNIYKEKVILRKLDKLCDRGYLEFGVSLRTGWLTEKGAALLQAALDEREKEKPRHCTEAL